MNIQTDFLVIGSGIAGLMFALKVADQGTVALITKKDIMETNTSQAQGGIASVFDQLDSFDLHIQDTLSAGDGLCNIEVVEKVVKSGPDRIRELIDLGVSFNLKEETGDDCQGQHFDLTREGGHSHNRIIHAQDMTGMELQKVLSRHVQDHHNIQVLENHVAIDLITCSTRIKRGVVTTTHEDFCWGVPMMKKR